MPVIEPPRSLWNLTPSSTALGSGSFATFGTAVLGQIVAAPAEEANTASAATTSGSKTTMTRRRIEELPWDRTEFADRRYAGWKRIGPQNRSYRPPTSSIPHRRPVV